VLGTDGICKYLPRSFGFSLC